MAGPFSVYIGSEGSERLKAILRAIVLTGSRVEPIQPKKWGTHFKDFWR